MLHPFLFGTEEKACLWHHHGDMGCCVCGPDWSLRFTVSFHVAYLFVWCCRESLCDYCHVKLLFVTWVAVCGPDGSLRFTVSFHGAQITIGTIGIGQLI